VVAVAGLAASVAHAAPLTPGVWLFAGNYGGEQRPGDARGMRVYVEFEEGAQPMILGISGSTGADCSKFPDRRTQVSYTVKKPQLPVNDDASFASDWMRLASSPGYTGRIKLKGTINSERVKGTLRLRMRIRGFGRCTTKHRFRVKLQAGSEPS
jgi:hypothetical protein